MTGARAFQRVKVQVKDVAGFVVVVLAMEIVILLAWQIVDPLQWDRKVVSYSISGYPTKSVGSCQSANGNGVYFCIALVSLNICWLFCALYLCYKVRKVPSQFQEGKWITASIISLCQVGIIAAPVLVIVQE